MAFKKDKVYLTREGLKKLTENLKKFKEKKEPELIKRVARARSFGDLTENSEYANAREELSFVKSRIDELEEIIARVLIVKSDKRKKAVAFGSKVTVKGNGQNNVFIVVGEQEADPTLKKISYNSPLGKALMGKKVGEKVEIKAPVGKIAYMIKAIT